MGIRDLIKRVQEYSGFSDGESRDALECMVESLAIHLSKDERADFASQLPAELEDIALTVYPTQEEESMDIIEQFMELEYIDEQQAKQQIRAAWRALKDFLTPSKIEQIKTHLPSASTSLLS